MIRSKKVSVMFTSKEAKESLQQICNQIYKDQGVSCYFCEVIGNRWSFIAGDKDILSAPVRYMVTERLGILADKEIADLEKYTVEISKF